MVSVSIYTIGIRISREESAVHNGTVDVHFQVKAGQHLVGVTFLATQLAPGNDLNQHFLRSSIETGGLPGFKFFPHVGKLEIIGPFKPVGAPDSPSRKKIFTCQPGDSTSEFSCAQEIVNTLARHAFRRPVTPLDTETLMSFYQQERQQSNFEGGIERALQRILADPEFVFRKEAEPPDVPPGKPYRISDVELASRLSFFLWSSIPDEELIQLAAANRLHEPAVLEPPSTQDVVRRALGTIRCQFCRAVAELASSAKLDSGSRAVSRFRRQPAARDAKETELFVESIVHEDRSVLDLLNADYTFVNERLAKHYGIPNVYGSNFRRVDSGPESSTSAGACLARPAFQTISSQPQRTSPVGRGKMIMQIFLGVESAGSAAERAGAQGSRSHRSRRRRSRRCASRWRCTAKWSPVQAATRSWTPSASRWRISTRSGGGERTDDGSPIDASGVLVDGTKVERRHGFKRKAILGYSPQFVRVLTEKLLIYALGRGTEYYDMPLVRSIVRDAEPKQLPFFVADPGNRQERRSFK